MELWNVWARTFLLIRWFKKKDFPEEEGILSECPHKTMEDSLKQSFPSTSPSLLNFSAFFHWISHCLLRQFLGSFSLHSWLFLCRLLFWNISFYISFSPLSFNLIKNLDLAAMKLIGLPFQAWTENAEQKALNFNQIVLCLCILFCIFIFFIFGFCLFPSGNIEEFSKNSKNDDELFKLVVRIAIFAIFRV